MTPTENHRPFWVKLLMPDGHSDGVKLIEKSNWTGAGLVIPRPLYSAVRKRPELQRTGIYLLMGPQADLQLTQVYVGEGDPIGSRLDQHAKNKDFWTHVVAFTSKDQSLNKAHVQFLESKLIELARRAKRCALVFRFWAAVFLKRPLPQSKQRVNISLRPKALWRGGMKRPPSLL